MAGVISSEIIGKCNNEDDEAAGSRARGSAGRG
jgi:hypothetical protein